MIQMMTAYTEEVDEAEDGIAEILGQINLGALKKNSLGIITCHFDFTETGFIAELCKKLPFTIIGMTTLASANPHGQSTFALSLTVLTSDDVVFEASLTQPLDPDNYREKIETSYVQTSGKLPGKPSMIITFFPYLKNLSGALMHRTFDDICGGVPFWGSIATDSDVSYIHSTIFLNGTISKGGLIMALLYGAVAPEFIVVSIPSQNIRKDRAQITGSDGCLLKEINGIPAMNYLTTMGVQIMENAPITTPLMVYYEGSSEPVALAIYTVYDDGSLLCGGEMTKGSFIAIGEITNEGIMETAGECITRVLKCGKKNGALLLPCVSRYVMLAPNHNAEVELIAERMEHGHVIPFMVAYSGGELCPVRDESGVLRNRFHNYTFCACII